MGSSGSGNFSDYPGSGGRARVGQGGGAGSGGQGALCDQEIDATLEEVERCAYFQANGLPPVGAEVTIRAGQRITAYVGAVQLGYLPTAFNYLLICLEDNYAYSGTVTVSIARPVVRVQIHATAEAP